MSSYPATKAPFRAEHLGSLLRPKELLEERKAFDAGTVSMEQLVADSDKAVDEAIKMQTDCGFHALTDGEYRYVYYRCPPGSQALIPRCEVC